MVERECTRYCSISFVTLPLFGKFPNCLGMELLFSTPAVATAWAAIVLRVFKEFDTCRNETQR